MVDVGQTPDSALSRQPQLAAALRLLKHGFALPAGDRVEALAWLLTGFVDDAESFTAAARYILEVHPEVTSEEVWQALHRLRPGKEAEMLSKAALEFIEQGRQQGREEGREQGRLEAQQEGLLKRRHMLSLQLERRFGPVPAELRTRMERATDEELDTWAVRVLDAASLEAVFDTEE